MNEKIFSNILKGYKKCITDGSNPMDFIKSIDSRIVMAIVFEYEMVYSNNTYNDLLKILEIENNKTKK
tara:strand:- start:847 stop:1050 length:204 start_codon:yes stop_codon:yes gene_type:complete